MGSAADISPRIGLIGLGNAGRAILEALSAQWTVHVYDRAPEKLADISKICRTPPVVSRSTADLAREVDLIILSLPTPAASLSVAQEILDVVNSGSVIVESSTVKPSDIDALHDLLSPTGARVIDAAVVGGVHKLAGGNGVFLVGAQEHEAGIAGAVLKSISEEIFFLNKRGDGMRTKLVVNAVSHTVYVMLLEAGALAAAQDIPQSVFYRLMERESGVMRPLTHRYGDRLMRRDFAGGMSTVNAHKDSGLILDVARTLGVPLFSIQAAHSAYEIGLREGLGSLDYASMGQLWENWLGISYSDDNR